jgi:hypothetical protein
MGYQHFKLLERGIPSAELAKRVAAYASRTSPENLAELILPYGFRQAPRKPRSWLLKHFLRPRQINPLKLRPLYAVLKQQGILFPAAGQPFRIDSAHLPADFITGFESRHCAALDCRRCRYCRDIAAEAVTIEPAFRQTQLEQLRNVKKQLVTGSLWRV